MRVKQFLNEYTLDAACDEIAKLDIYRNPYDQFLFCEAAIKYARLSMRSKYGIDPVALYAKERWADLSSSLLQKHPNLDNDMAFILVTSAITIEIFEAQARPGNDPSAEKLHTQ